MVSLVMGKPPKYWVHKRVYKLAALAGQQPLLVRGEVVKYVPGTAQFLVRFEDGELDGLSPDELEDVVPVVSHSTPTRPHKRDTSHLDVPDAPVVKQQKREACGSSAEPPTRLGASKLALRLVRDLLWALTTFPGGSNQSNLRRLLEDQSEQPQVSLARYVEAGGLATMAETLRAWVCHPDSSAGDNDVETAGLAFLLQLMAELPGHAESAELQEKLQLLASHSDRRSVEDDAHALTTTARWAMDEWERKFAATATALRAHKAAGGPSQAPLPSTSPIAGPSARESRAEASRDGLEATDEAAPAPAPRAATCVSPRTSKSIRHLRTLVQGGRRATAARKPSERKVLAIGLAAAERQRARAETQSSATSRASSGPVTVDLTCEDAQEDAQGPEDGSATARRRLRFGEVTSVVFWAEEATLKVQQQLRLDGDAAALRSPTQSGRPWKSALKTRRPNK